MQFAFTVIVYPRNKVTLSIEGFVRDQRSVGKITLRGLAPVFIEILRFSMLNAFLTCDATRQFPVGVVGIAASGCPNANSWCDGSNSPPVDWGITDRRYDTSNTVPSERKNTSLYVYCWRYQIQFDAIFRWGCLCVSVLPQAIVGEQTQNRKVQ